MSPVASLPASCLGSDSRGTAALEFAFVAPLLIFILLGIIQFGLTINDYEMLTGATQAAARQLSLSRGRPKPYTDMTTALQQAAPNLDSTVFVIKVSVSGQACTDDGSCQKLLPGNQGGQSATLTISYPCSLSFFGYEFAKPCTLTSKVTESIE